MLRFIRQPLPVAHRWRGTVVRSELSQRAMRRFRSADRTVHGTEAFVVETYSFRRVASDDLSMVGRWLETPAVREWWIDSEGHPAGPIEEDDLADDHVAMWIVSYLGNPFAWIQDYDPHAWDGHHFGHLPPGSRGVDQFIWRTGHARPSQCIQCPECLGLRSRAATRCVQLEEGRGP